MRLQINKKEMKREWVLDTWYNKATFIMGVLYIVLYIIGLIFGGY